MFKRRFIPISIIVLSLLYMVCSEELVQRGDRAFAVVAKLDSGPGRSITILRDTEPFEVPAWYCEISENGQIVFPITFLYGCCRSSDSSPKFEVLTTRDNTVVGLVWTKRPGVLLAVYDFATGESSRGDSVESLTDRLRADNPHTKLMLSSHVP